MTAHPSLGATCQVDPDPRPRGQPATRKSVSARPTNRPNFENDSQLGGYCCDRGALTLETNVILLILIGFYKSSSVSERRGTFQEQHKCRGLHANTYRHTDAATYERKGRRRVFGPRCADSSQMARHWRGTNFRPLFRSGDQVRHGRS